MFLAHSFTLPNDSLTHPLPNPPDLLPPNGGIPNLKLEKNGTTVYGIDAMVNRMSSPETLVIWTVPAVITQWYWNQVMTPVHLGFLDGWIGNLGLKNLATFADLALFQTLQSDYEGDEDQQYIIGNRIVMGETKGNCVGTFKVTQADHDADPSLIVGTTVDRVWTPDYCATSSSLSKSQCAAESWVQGSCNDVSISRTRGQDYSNEAFRVQIDWFMQWMANLTDARKQWYNHTCSDPSVLSRQECTGEYDIASQDFQCWIEEDLFRGLPQCPPQQAPENTFWSNAMNVYLELQDVVLIFDFVAKISEYKFLSLRMDQLKYPSCWLSTLADRCGDT